MHEVTLRFLDCLDALVRENKVKSRRQFALSLDWLPQNLNEVVKKRRDVTIDFLQRAINRYHFNPHYIFNGEGTLFSDEESVRRMQLLTIVTDSAGAERIVHIPYPAQAGYSGAVADEEFIENLPSYTLPDPIFQYGTFRSFDIEGDSMQPTLENGDVVICSFVEPCNWESSIRDDKVYVVVTNSNIIVKRIKNNLRKHRHLELISDNPDFSLYRLNVGEIREVWEVKKLLKDFDPGRKPENHAFNAGLVHSLQETIQYQRELIADLKKMISKSVETV